MKKVSFTAFMYPRCLITQRSIYTPFIWEWSFPGRSCPVVSVPVFQGGHGTSNGKDHSVFHSYSCVFESEWLGAPLQTISMGFFCDHTCRTTRLLHLGGKQVVWVFWSVDFKVEHLIKQADIFIGIQVGVSVLPVRRRPSGCHKPTTA